MSNDSLRISYSWRGGWRRFYDRAFEISPDAVVLCGDVEALGHDDDMMSLPGRDRNQRLGGVPLECVTSSDFYLG